MTAPSRALDGLAAAVRKACSPRAWSSGVILARDEAVTGKEESEDEIVLAVRVPEQPIPRTVVLYPETEEWDCDCPAQANACAHVAAAIIALTQAKQSGDALPAPKKAGATLRYRLRKEGERLHLERLLVAPSGQVSVLAEAASRAAARPVEGARLSLSEADLRLEPLLQQGKTTVTSAEQVALLLAELAETEVELDGRPVRVSREKVLPVGRLDGGREQLTLQIGKNPEITAVLAPGLALCGEVLRPLGELALTGARLEKLPTRKAYPRAAFAELVGEVLPLFRGRVDIRVETPHLPAASGPMAPRLDLRVEHGAENVSVTPELVYGDPAVLRIEDGRPVYLRGAVPERDHAAERRLVERLRDELNLTTGRRVTVRGGEAPTFLRRLRDFQAELAGEGGALELPRLVPRVNLDEGRFSLGFLLEGAGEGEAARDDGATARAPKGADAAQVLAAFEGGHDVAPLLGGGWAELPKDWLHKHGERLSLLLRLSGEDGELPPSAIPTVAELCADLDQPPPAAVARLAPLLAGFQHIPQAALPADLTASLRPYQLEGVSWLAFLRDAGLGAVLADDMGLGKTLQAIAAFQGRVLVVCPTSVLPNWQSEVQRFRPNLRVNVFHGPSRALDDADVTLTTYALLLRDEERLAATSWDVLVLDEAQAIKNAESQTARAAFRLEAKFRVALTGTPVENRLEELWSQLHFTNPGLLYGRTEFTRRFAKPIGDGDAEAVVRLRERIRPFVLRRLKREVAKDLPPRTEMVLYAELDDAERGVYDAIRLATKREVVAKLAAGGSVLAALEALLRLRQACCHAGLVPGQEAETSSKVETLLESLTEAVAEGHKALVFSQWTSLLDKLEPHLARADLPFVRLDGSTTDRGAKVAEFQREDGPPVMIISLKAGGTGLNLTAADHVFLLDPWWNPAVEDQAADRAHRIGQDRPVMIHRLVARRTVEERILELQQKKRALADAALGDAGAAASLTREDLLALLD